MFTRLGQFTFRRRRLVITVWGALTLLGVLAAAGVGSSLTSDVDTAPHYESQRANRLLSRAGGDDGHIYAVAQGARPPDVAAAADDVRHLRGVAHVQDGIRSRDGRSIAVDVAFAKGQSDEERSAAVDAARDRLRRISARRVVVGGDLLQDEEFSAQSQKDLQRGEAVALPVALATMIVIFGGVVAAGVPLLIALAGVSGAFIFLLATTALGDVSVFAVNVATMFGLGLGIDYGLLMVNRFREERAAGLEIEHAVERTVATAGVTVAFSALTVAVALCGLFALDVPALHSIAAGGIGVVLAAMAAALTLAPALLAVAGRRIGVGRVTAGVAGCHGYFARIARLVQRRAVPVILVVGLGLVVVATPLLHASFGRPDGRSLPRSSPSRQLWDIGHAQFPAQVAEPVTVVARTSSTDPRLEAWVDEVRGLPGVRSVAVDDRSGMSVVDIVPAGDGQSEAGQRLVHSLRRDRPAFPVLVTGNAAEMVDFKAALFGRLPTALAIVALATLVLLFIMTSSVVVALKALVMNALSLGATLGVLAWVFQEGHLSGVLGFESTGSLDVLAPVLVLLFALGLSTDYEVFLLSRIKEVYERIGDNDTAVAEGLQHTGRIITSAALLIVVVFAGFATGGFLVVKELGLGLAVAVVIDATFVRTLLVPAAMKLMGDRNWWAPRPLRRLHRLTAGPGKPEVRAATFAP
ncbi:MAG: MMPL family transporter [Actinobacteria bacterium]|nr:MAG: MMPL family transporter [Actinomycetota bacterium]